ncbi:MAG TPA: alpha/beta fold hydrolase [Ignavibacteria bacterium]|jgi:esterase/lipase
MKRDILIPIDNNANISADFYNSNEDAAPLIIFVHGFKGFKDWGGFPFLLEKLSTSGYSAVSFNFSFNGVSKENPTEFTRLDLFAQNTFSRELKELGLVIDHFYSKSNHYRIDKNRIALIGHSRGGGISILKASSDKRIKFLVTLSSVSGFDRYSDKLKQQWKKHGYIEVENARTKQMMRMNVSMLEDIEKNRDRLDIVSAISRLKIPVLLVHGREDLAVKHTEAEELYNNSDKKLTELFLVENTGHTFGVVHPFEGTTKPFETVIEKIKRFLKAHL